MKLLRYQIWNPLRYRPGKNHFETGNGKMNQEKGVIMPEANVQ